MPCSIIKSLRAVVPLCLIALAGAHAHAQIYQWTDKDGNVHYGDKPTTVDGSPNAKEITVQEAYVPTPAASSLTPDEVDIQQREAALQRSMKARLEREERKAQEDLVKRQENEARTADICAAVLKEIKALSEIEVIDDIPTFYYKTHADGTDYTSAEQDAYVRDLTAQAKEFGCDDIPDTASN